jgi:HNH endonuclease/AP2 domain
MALPKDISISFAFLRECLSRDDATPHRLRWNHRPLAHFPDERTCKIWNTKWAGKPAGSLNKHHGYWIVMLPVGNRLRPVKTQQILWTLDHGRRPEYEVDHANRHPADNWPVNLREATRVDVRGVHWHKPTGQWRVRIRVGRRDLHVGLFDTFEEACDARRSAENVYHPFHVQPKPIHPLDLIPEGSIVTECYRIGGEPRWTTTFAYA